MATGDGPKTVSHDPSDYASFIIYIKNGNPACERIKDMCSSHSDFIIQDVDMIRTNKPPWLTGVPTVVRLPSYDVVTGSAAIETVKIFLETRINGITSEFSSTVPSASLSVDDLQIQSDPRYEDREKESLCLEDMMRRRK